MARSVTLRRGVNILSGLKLDGTSITATAAEINAACDIATPGTVEASKGLVVDANKDLAGLRHLTATGTVTAGAIAANDSSLDIAGLAASSAGNGGAVALVAGRAHTNGTGGAISVTAGAGSATGTGAGGTAALTAGASGGGSTGNGGAVSITGGAAASTNGNGGQANVTGGAATGTGTGGAVNITAGASAGAGGTAGAVIIDAGAATGGTGAAVSIGATNAASVAVGAATVPVTVSGAKPVLGIVRRCTAAEVNAGYILLADAAGRTVTVLDCRMRAIGGAAADVTSVDLVENTSGNLISRQVVAQLTENTICGAWTTNSVHTYTGVAGTAGKGFTIIKNGSNIATATHIDVFVQYTLS